LPIGLFKAKSTMTVYHKWTDLATALPNFEENRSFKENISKKILKNRLTLFSKSLLKIGILMHKNLPF
jgi:hypothetical protein